MGPKLVLELVYARRATIRHIGKITACSAKSGLGGAASSAIPSSTIHH